MADPKKMERRLDDPGDRSDDTPAATWTCGACGIVYEGVDPVEHACVGFTLIGNDPPPVVDAGNPGAVPASRQHPSLLASETPPNAAPEQEQLAPPAPPVAVLVDHSKEKPDEQFEPTGKAVPWMTSTGKPPQSTPWTVQPKDGATPAPAPIQSIPLVRCPTCKTDRVHRYGRSKTADGKPGNIHYYQCQNCTDPRTGYALTRFKVLHT